MGQENSTPQGLPENFRILKRSTDSSQSELILVQNLTTNNIHIAKEYAYTEERDYQADMQRFNDMKIGKLPNVLGIEGVFSKLQKDFCSSTMKIYVLFEAINNPLQSPLYSMIQEKQNDRNLAYKEEEIWKVIKESVNGLASLEKEGVPHRNIRPATIFETEEGLKVSDPVALNQTSLYYDVFTNINGKHPDVFLSPNLMQSLRDNLMNPVHDPFKSDIYSLGFIALQMGTLNDFEKIFNYENTVFNDNEYNEQMNILKGKYSPELYECVKIMTEKDETLRPDAIELKSKIDTNSILKVEKSPDKMSSYQAVHQTPERNEPILVENSEKPSLQIPKYDTEYKPRTQNLPKYTEIKKPSQIYSQPDPLKSVSIQPKTASNFNYDPMKVEKIVESIQRRKLNEIPMHENNYRPTVSQTNQLKSSFNPILTNLDRYSTQSDPFKPLYSVKQAFPIKNSQQKPAFQKASVYETTTESYPNGTRYEGQTLHGKKFGRGILYYPDGGYYQGEWNDNQINGVGKLFYKSGKLAYEGNWKHGKFDGWGVIYNEIPVHSQRPTNIYDFDSMDDSWVKYEGYFHDDNKEGFGKLFFTNGDVFEGNFHEDVANGEGTFKPVIGAITRGKWFDNKLTVTI